MRFGVLAFFDFSTKVKMAACEVELPTQTVLEKIESFLQDPAYKEAIENAASYNSRLCIERRLRMPFLDSHTGVAQRHTDLFKNKRQRMPGLLPGQVYTYPSKPWCKRRRQYLMHWMNPRRKELEGEDSNHAEHTPINEDSKDSIGLKDENAKDSWYYDDEMIEMDGYEEPDPDSDYDYEENYRGRRKKRNAKQSSNRSRNKPAISSPSVQEPPCIGGRGGRGRKRALLYDMDNDKPFACELCSARYKTRPGLTYHYTHSHKETRECGEVSASDTGDSNSVERGSPKPSPVNATSGTTSTGTTTTSNLIPPNMQMPIVAVTPIDSSGPPGSGQFQDSYLTFLKVPGGGSRRGGRQSSAILSTPPPGGMMHHHQHHHQQQQQHDMGGLQHHHLQQQQHHHHQQGNASVSGSLQTSAKTVHSVAPVDSKKELKDERTASSSTKKEAVPDPEKDLPVQKMALPDDKARATPSPYCDFCLGDSTANKKTNIPEELVSCSDCGRSGHPTCLQFTPNMIVSVRKYRWQCIECKCCSICGTSDNDDQLLFCDDCDRGYHMYCLAPPLMTPPEGSWSCRLCLIEFHHRSK